MNVLMILLPLFSMHYKLGRVHQMKTLRPIRKTSNKEDPPDKRYCTPYNGLRGCRMLKCCLQHSRPIQIAIE